MVSTSASTRTKETHLGASAGAAHREHSWCAKAGVSHQHCAVTATTKEEGKSSESNIFIHSVRFYHPEYEINFSLIYFPLGGGTMPSRAWARGCLGHDGKGPCTQCQGTNPGLLHTLYEPQPFKPPPHQISHLVQMKNAPCLFVLDHTQQCLGLAPGPVIRDLFENAQRSKCGVRDLNLGQWQPGQVPAVCTLVT